MGRAYGMLAWGLSALASCSSDVSPADGGSDRAQDAIHDVARGDTMDTSVADAPADAPVILDTFTPDAAASTCEGGATHGTPPTDGGSCLRGESFCAGSCVNLASDPQNCGACGAICAIGLLCEEGACVCACPASDTCCFSACTGYCVSLADDSANCGACGRACPGGAVCVAGLCSGRPDGG